MIADQLLQRQRSEVEDERDGFNNYASDDVYIQGVLLTESPNVTSPIAHVLESLVNQLDHTGEEFDAHSKFGDIASSVHVSGNDNDDISLRSQASQPHAQSAKVKDSSRDNPKVKRTHKVHVVQNLINELRIILN